MPFSAAQLAQIEKDFAALAECARSENTHEWLAGKSPEQVAEIMVVLMACTTWAPAKCDRIMRWAVAQSDAFRQQVSDHLMIVKLTDPLLQNKD